MTLITPEFQLQNPGFKAVRSLLWLLISMAAMAPLALAQKQPPTIIVPSGNIPYSNNDSITCTDDFQGVPFQSTLIIDGDIYPSGSYSSSNGVTTFTLPFLAPGGHTGQCQLVNNTSMVSNQASFTIVQSTPAIHWTAPAAISYGTALSSTQLSATATSAVFTALSVPGTFAYSPAAGSVPAAGTQTLAVAFTPTATADWTTATGTVSLQVNKLTPGVSVSCSPSSAIYGSTYVCTASISDGTGSATGTVVWTENGVSLGSSSVAGNSATIRATANGTLGTFTITAAYGGDGNNNAASASTPITISQAGQAISFSPPASPVTYGVSPIALSATGGASGNPVTFSVISGPGSISGSTLTVIGVGTIVVAANQAGNADYAAAAQVTQSVVVNGISQTISFTAPASPVSYGASPISLSATGGGSGNPVIFSLVSGPGSVSGSTLSIAGVGTIVVAANQAGSADYSAAAQVTRSVVVNQASQTINFTAPATPVVFGVSPLALSATGGNSGNPITFSLVSGPGSVSGSTLTLNGVGTVVVAANQAGNTNYAAAPQVTHSVVVTQQPQTINFTTPASPVVYGAAPVALSATGGGSGNPVVFSILSGPGSISGNTLAFDEAGSILVAANQAGNANFSAAPQVTKTVVVQYGADVITTVAGNGTEGYSGDNGQATSAMIYLAQGATTGIPISGVALDSAGNIYFADTDNSRVREVTVATGIVTTIAGPGTNGINGLPGTNGDGGLAINAGLACPNAIAIDSSNNVYIADSCVGSIRKITASTGIISSVLAGGGNSVYAGANFLQGLAVDGAGNVYYTDATRYQIHMINTSGTDTVVAGNTTEGTPGYTGDGGPATSAQLDGLSGLAVTSSGNIFFVDIYDSVVREVTSAGIISTVAGGGYGCSEQTDSLGDGCLATSALLNEPLSLAVDASGNLYISDTGTGRIRLVTASSGVISTVAGGGTGCAQQTDTAGDNCVATSAILNGPTGIAADSARDFFFADSYHFRIRAVGVSNKALPILSWATPAAINYGTALSATELNATSLVAGTFAYTPAAGTVPKAGTQTLSVTFTPTDTVDYQPSSISVPLEVNKATPVISWANPATIAFGTALSATQLNATSAVGGSFGYTPAAGTILGAGPHSLLAILLPTDTNDYNPATAEVNLSVTDETGATSDSGTITLTINSIVSATTAYGSTSTTASIAAGLAAGVTSSSPVTLTAVNDALYMQAKLTGSATDYSYTIQAVSNTPADFNPPSFAGSPASGQLTSGANSGAAGPVVYSYAATFDGVGNPVDYSDPVMGTWGPISNDSLNRLTAATVVPPGGPTAYYCWGYDAFGNRTTQVSSNEAFAAGSPACTTATGATATINWATYSTANNNRLATSTQSPGGITYDNAGNVLNDGRNQYLYDAEGRICAVASTPVPGITTMTGYVYDAGGTRVAKGSITKWSCDPVLSGFKDTNDFILGPSEEQVTEMALDSNNTMAWQHTNVFGAGHLVASYDHDGLHFLLNDPLGTRRVQTDSAGVVEQSCSSLPYGDNLACTNSILTPTEHHFTGKERDTESGNDYFDARYYSSSMGRFMSPDWSDAAVPVPFATLSDPQTLNLYAYVRNNPLGLVDAYGHGWWGDFWKGLSNATWKPLVSMVEHPIIAGKAIKNAAIHPVATFHAMKSGVVTTTQQVFTGNGEAIGLAVGTVGMNFIPGAGEAGDAAEVASDVEKVGEAAEAAEAAEDVVNTAGHGNIGGGSTTAENALTQADKYLGPGSKEIAPGVFRSADGTRQFRMTTSDLTGAHGDIGPHVHFESIGSDGRTITENSHVGITNP